MTTTRGESHPSDRLRMRGGNTESLIETTGEIIHRAYLSGLGRLPK